MRNIWEENILKQLESEAAQAALPPGARYMRIDSVRTETVIVVEACEGAGTAEDPARITKTFWTLDGERLGTVPG